MADIKSNYNKVSKQYHKNFPFFGFLHEIYFLLGHFYFKCNLKNP